MAAASLPICTQTTATSTCTPKTSTFTSTGEQGHGIYTRFQNGIGDILVDVRGGSITTKDADTYGLYNRHEGAGNIDIDVRNLDLKTESTGDPQGYGTASFGIFGWHGGDGDIDIDVLGGSITTAGTYSYGIYGIHESAGDITIDTRDGHTITTTGNNAHGIVAYHFGTEDSRAIDITVGGTVDASGAGSHGVRVGIVNGDGEAERVAAVGEDGYRKQTVTVNGPVVGGMGEAAGGSSSGLRGASTQLRASRFSRREIRPTPTIARKCLSPSSAST